MTKPLSMMVCGLLLVGAGVAAGWWAAARHGHSGRAGEAPGHHDNHGPAAPPVLTPQALANLGVVVGEATPGSFSKYLAVPAVVEELPGAVRPLFSPVDGRLMEIRHQAGNLVSAGEVLATFLRDSEEFNQAIYSVRKAVRSAALLTSQFRDAPSNLDLLNARTDLRRHGLTDAQIAAIEAWENPAEEGRVFQAVTDFLQKGSALRDEALMERLKTLGFVAELRAPSPASGDDWDVREILAKPGAHLAAGAPVLTLADSRQMLLKTEPVGLEAKAMLAALEKKLSLEAVPLVEGEAPRLSGLTISYIASDPDAHGTDGFIRAGNEPFQVREDEKYGRYRTWHLRAGQRFMVRIPMETFDNVFVLPADAVAEDGPDKVVFIQDGESFRAARVVIRYQDDEVAVLDGGMSDLFPGDAVVERGAFALGFALKAGSAVIDPHAGHSH